MGRKGSGGIQWYDTTLKRRMASRSGSSWRRHADVVLAGAFDSMLLGYGGV